MSCSAPPRRQVALFLNRLFGGDGFLHIRQGTGQVVIDYSSKSERLIRDVQHLLLRFGINAVVKHLKSGHHPRLDPGSWPLPSLFLEEVGLLGRARADEALNLLSQSTRIQNPNRDTVPP